MKKIIIISSAILGLTFSSCKKYLDIEPKQTVGSNLVVTNLQGLQASMVGAFSKLQSSNLYGGGIIANTELWADYVNTGVISDFSLSQFRSHQFNSYNAQATGLWNDAYNAILIVNTVLKYLPNFQTQNPALVKQLTGECYFVRGIMHYELVREFAQPSGYTTDDSHLGVPLLLIPTDLTHGQNTKRSKVSEVYAQVISDLQKADSLLPTTPDNVSIFVTKYAAEAFLAKAYFSQTANISRINSTQAAHYASLVIQSGQFALDQSLDTIYYNFSTASPSTTEGIFQIINEPNDDDNSSLYGRFWYIGPSLALPEYYMNAPFISIIQSAKAVGDLRAALFPSVRGNANYLCAKYKPVYSNVTVVRLAEMYLTRAESNAQLGAADATVRADYNMTRVRAGLVADNSTSGQAALLNAIHAERDLELAMEGDHYFEVKRRKGVFNNPFVGIVQWNDQSMIYPIPAQEVNQNSAMVQNPGY